MIFLEKMAYYYSCAPVENIMINLWYHQIHRRIKNGQKCNCEYSIHCCLIEAKRKWKK